MSRQVNVQTKSGSQLKLSILKIIRLLAQQIFGRKIGRDGISISIGAHGGRRKFFFDINKVHSLRNLKSTGIGLYTFYRFGEYGQLWAKIKIATHSPIATSHKLHHHRQVDILEINPSLTRYLLSHINHLINLALIGKY